jgi:hypothetical protein
MPYPGPVLDGPNKFDGHIDRTNNELVEFFKYVEHLIPELLNPKNVVVKTKGTDYMTGQDLKERIPEWLNLAKAEIRRQTLVGKNVGDTTREIFALTMSDAAIEHYREMIILNLIGSPMSPEVFGDMHDLILIKTLEMFTRVDEEYKGMYENITKGKIDESFKLIKTLNAINWDLKMIGRLNGELLEISDKFIEILRLARKLDNEQIAIARTLGKTFAYRMTAKPRGFCILINNIEFRRNELRRHGADEDAKSLREVFNYFHFDVREKKNLTSTKMFKFLRKSSQSCNAKHDALVVIVSSHGSDGVVYGTDGKEVKIKDILELFNNEKCPALLGKPKIFFLLACRGGE